MSPVEEQVRADFPRAKIGYRLTDGGKEGIDCTLVIPTKFVVVRVMMYGRPREITQPAVFIAQGVNKDAALFNAYILALRGLNMHGHHQ